LAIASERPTTSACQLVDILVKDRELPADIRMAIAREFFVRWKIAICRR
jgi:hypothetical protein